MQLAEDRREEMEDNCECTGRALRPPARRVGLQAGGEKDFGTTPRKTGAGKDTNYTKAGASDGDVSSTKGKSEDNKVLSDAVKKINAR